jgi:sugar phosphate isomerase/epimerase
MIIMEVMYMKIGMYSVEVQRPTVEELFEAVKEYGFTQVQFDFSSVCEEQMPEKLDREFVKNIYEQAKARGIEIIAVNGTFNMIHPDPNVRNSGYKRFEVIADACKYLHCNFITICTGSRNPENMWRWHDENLTQEAWDDMMISMEKTLEIAQRYDVILGLECEASNCINTPERARKLMDELKSPRLKVIMDAANLFQRGDAKKENVKMILDNAFSLLGDDIYIAHGKDIKEGEGLNFTHAGNGIVDFDYFMDKLKSGFCC